MFELRPACVFDTKHIDHRSCFVAASFAPVLPNPFLTPGTLAQQTPREMDSLHITEFGSERYLDKINRPQTSITPPPSTAAPPSQFLLPFRGAYPPEAEDATIRASEQKRTEKKGFLSFRKFHAKATSSSNSLDQGERRFLATEPLPRQSTSFDRQFHFLPTELQVEIIASLPLSDILNLRLASRSLHALISLNEAPIARHHLDNHVPAYAKRLYPPPAPSALNLHYLCGIWHRLHVAAKLSYLMCEWISRELFLRNTEEKKKAFAPQRERMRRRLIPLLFTIFHFFEIYREHHLKYLAENDGKGLLREPYTINPIEAQIMSLYDDKTLLRVHEVFPLVISSFCRRLRPPSYVGLVERSIRGYLRDKPPDEVHVAILCIGGLREVERIWEVKGYNTRRAAVDNWYNSITRDTAEQEPKKKRGMLGLKRKKSSFGMGKNSLGDAVVANARVFGEASMTARDPMSDLVFNTSLSTGRPMGPLARDQLKLLLSDLPILQKIFLETAEALILERKIVERASDIKRNAQIFIDLICEDRLEEEDQWWYGTVAPESVRPNLEAIEEDVLE
ncbi:uncharacterized protein B0T23DRAFT_327477 [Neurospora hispaniola]|uniref:F-box domain-containing protein n=1 Tax=Neurospora hispaniola TaxID=588809 RepID=A0AAJ0MLP8_9PEZI|nr:hypothetical protein B0T23DRAFT_327477 [Neurospora hispaniola]